MKPLVKKEIRLLLPAWSAALVLGVVSLFWWPGRAQGMFLPINVHTLCLLFGGALLGIASFGQEFSSAGFTLLLSQPVERRRIWRIKIAVLAVAFLSIWLFLPATFSGSHRPTLLELWEHDGLTALWAFALLSGGLWTTLLLRQMTGAFWLTLVMPLAIVFAISAPLNAFISSGQIVNTAASFGLALYAVVGFFWARRLFLGAQDVQWTGGIIGLPSRRAVAEQVVARPRHRLAALFWKEMQLNQANFLVAGLVLALHLASVLIRKVHPHFHDRNVEYILEVVWVLWLLMPLLIGSAAIAEERKLGVLESQLCLPVSRRVQLVVKSLVGLLLSLILGAVMPLAIEFPQNLLALTHSGLPFFVVAAAIYFISFYASTLARSVPQALGIAIAMPAVVGACLIGLTQWLFRTQTFPGEYAGRTFLAIRLGWPVLVLVVAWLAAGNFKRLHEPRKLWRHNAAAVVAAFVFIGVMTNVIYFRAWELLTPFKLPHGPARLSASNPPRLSYSSDVLAAILPDGRLRIETLSFNNTFRYLWWSSLAPVRCEAQFIGGSNWVDAASGMGGILAIRSDGSLWCILENSFFPGTSSRTQITKIVQVGSATNWREVGGGGFGHGGFLLLKKDGTLWNWGTNWVSKITHMQALNLATPPVQIGHQTNWAEVHFAGIYPFARKNDGSLWLYTASGPIQETNMNFRLKLAASDFNRNMLWSAAVKADGQLWWSWSKFTNNAAGGSSIAAHGKMQLNPDAQWKAVAFDSANNSLLALRSDGTLWRWSRFRELRLHPDLVRPTQVGSYSNWIALGSKYAIALAADGSLWSWGAPSSHAWLAPSRRPVFLGNIFQGQRK